jgi:hypothetical protein
MKRPDLKTGSIQAFTELIAELGLNTNFYVNILRTRAFSAPVPTSWERVGATPNPFESVTFAR